MIGPATEDQLKAIRQLRFRGRARSALSAANELLDHARAEKKLIPFLLAGYEAMQASQELLEPQKVRQFALEVISLLESPDRAAEFQSDYPQPQYQQTAGWLTACAFDQLATATGSLLGFNSDDLQAILAGGADACRRTGKLQDIACFREYATQVSRAGDDIEMALHHARVMMSRPKDARNLDRRWIGAFDEADLLLLAGHLKPAQDAAMQALQLTPTYERPMAARQRTLVLLNTILLLDGREKEYAALAAPHQAAISPDAPDEGECLAQDLRDDLLEALGDCCRGDYASAIQTLAQWDKALTINKCLHEWFEVRLRLIAATKLAGSGDKLPSLTEELESKAREAQDFLTLRRLSLMQDGREPATPLPPAMVYVSGRFAASPFSAGAEPAAAPAPENGELGPVIDRIGGAFANMARSAQETNTPPDATPMLLEALDIEPPRTANANDASRLLHLAPYLIYNIKDVSLDERTWDWAQAIAANHPGDARCISLLATLGDALRHRDNSPLTSRTTFEELSAMFRKSLALESNAPRLWAQAGMFYLDNEQLALAERCLARASRLDRSDETVALRLADIYARSDRPGDALIVLDMCLRAGTVTPPVLWEAGILASAMNRHDLVLQYLDRFESLEPGRPWVGYYRSISLFSLGRMDEAAQAIEAEAQRTPGGSAALHVVSIRAAIASASKHLDAVREQLAVALATPLRQITNLTANGIAMSLARLWTASEVLPESDDLRRSLEDRILANGLAVEPLLRQARAKKPVKAGLTHFRITLHQPLDENWATSPAAMPGQENWKSYEVMYGVLAVDEELASSTVLAWQSRCAPLPGEVKGIERDPGQFTDRPGVTGRRFPTAG